MHPKCMISGTDNWLTGIPECFHNSRLPKGGILLAERPSSVTSTHASLEDQPFAGSCIIHDPVETQREIRGPFPIRRSPAPR
ncbi:unnamed protein product [Lasius platythorax]|uniref:Uncharacterized protein n=1 Tax=Lasius platythorax TaxID=488582 RepID=A0AAV2ND01_9HYME